MKFTGGNSLDKWKLISNFKSPCFALVKRSSAPTGSLILIEDVFESSQWADSKTSLTNRSEAVDTEKLVIACRLFHKIPRDMAKIKNMVIPTRRIESIGSFWCLLILRSKELANYKYSKCHLIRCLLYVQIASKIKTDDCRMLLSPESHSKAKSSINGPTLMPLLVFSFWNYPQLKRYCNFYCRASSLQVGRQK
jgi:hypothetical protein